VKDKTIPISGGPNGRGDNPEIRTWANAWATRDGLDANANVTEKLCEKENRVTKFSWGKNEEVVHYRVKNLGHDWPSKRPNGDTQDTTCDEADATSVILKWFGKWKL